MNPWDQQPFRKNENLRKQKKKALEMATFNHVDNIPCNFLSIKGRVKTLEEKHG